VPYELKTAEICLTAVRLIDQALKDVPEDCRMAELYITVVMQCGFPIAYVPEELREQVKKAAGIR